MKNRTSFYFVAGLIALAIIGIISSLISNPMAFVQSIIVLLIIGFGIIFLVRRFNGANPGKREQNAFKKAAKRSKKRFQQQKENRKQPTLKSSTGNISAFRKAKTKPKSTAHLTVIEGKKGKKKKRASF